MQGSRSKACGSFAAAAGAAGAAAAKAEAGPGCRPADCDRREESSHLPKPGQAEVVLQLLQGRRSPDPAGKRWTVPEGTDAPCLMGLSNIVPNPGKTLGSPLAYLLGRKHRPSAAWESGVGECRRHSLFLS